MEKEPYTHYYAIGSGSKYVRIGPFGFELVSLGEATLFNRLDRAHEILPVARNHHEDARIDMIEMFIKPVMW